MPDFYSFRNEKFLSSTNIFPIPFKGVGKFLLILLFFSSEIACAQQWYSSFIPRGRHVNSIKILDTSHIVAGGGWEFNDSLQELFLSSDKGLTWEGSSTNSIKPWIKSMDFSDSIHGLSCGYTGTILRTDNGARLWSPVSTPITRQFNKVKFVNPQLVFIAGGSVPREDTLQTILKSTDSGRTWSVMLDRKGYWLRSIDFIDANNGTAVGDSGVILRTTNGGANWNTITSPLRKNLNSIKFISSTVGYIAGGIGAPDSISTILRTVDGGATWTVLRNDSLGILNDITFLNSSTGYIVGDHATVLKTTNAGSNWSRVIIPNTQPYDNFNSVDFYSNNLGTIGGKYGSVYTYTTSVLPSAFTFGSQAIDTLNATLSAGINTHGETASYSFYYSTDSTFSSYANTYPVSVKSDAIALVNAPVYPLMPHQTYYFYIQAQTLAGIAKGNTLSFFTGTPAYTTRTLPATGVGSTSASLNGLVDKFPTSLNISFEYGTTPSFGNTIAGVPSNVNDTLSHGVSATVSGLQPNTIYYFRLKGMHNTQAYYGDVLTFFTGSPFSTFQTLAASNIFDSAATLNATLDKFRLPVTLSFQYSTNPYFLSSEITASPPSINDTLQHNVFVNLNNLTAGTLYYFRIKGQTPFSEYYGDILTFSAGIGFSYFNTLDASNIGNTSAQLNANAVHFATPVTLSFEYGPTSSLGSTIAASPSFISDTAYHNISATLFGLVADSIYFYRIKATTGVTTIYGDTKQFFAGEPEIPNWDFQFWRTDTVNIPQDWNVIQESFARVPGHNSNYALNLSGQTIVLNGFIADQKGFYGGVPINPIVRPDSIVFFANYNIAPGDTAFSVIMLKKQTHFIANTFLPLSGNSGGIFKRLAYKINYDSIATPDSMICGFVTTNVNTGPSAVNSNTLTVDDISLEPGNVTFVNSNFEDWFSSIVERPLSWFNIRYIALDPAHTDSNHMVHKVFFDAPNDYAAEAQNILWKEQDIVIGGELTAKLGVTDDNGGFPVRGRHYTLNGYYKFFPQPGDTLSFGVSMSKNRMQIGQGSFYTGTAAPDFTPFSIPITYPNTNEIPDTAALGFKIVSVNLKQGSKFVLDKLSFDGFVTKVKKPDVMELDGMKVYPNPTRDHLIIENLLSSDKEGSLTLMNVSGQMIKQVKLIPGERTAQMEVSDLSPGFYLLMMKKGDQTFSKKIVIQ
ncbi:MAG: hypothetical protein JWN78_1980 [Bacteroidota bacterium]|nr:hypothetical protein [Bacteroidota bacterium]